MGAFVVTKMKGYRQSYVEILNLKMAVRDELLQTWLPACGLKPTQVSQIQDVMRDFGSIRKWVTPYPDGKGNTDTAWMVGQSAVVLAILEVFEALFYSNAWDARYKDAVKTKLRVADFLDYESVREALDELTNQIRAEKLQQGNPDGAGDGANPGGGSPGAPPSSAKHWW